MSITKVTDGGLDRSRIVTPLIINGDMSVAQRATSATGLGASSGYNTCDRWKLEVEGSPSADLHKLNQQMCLLVKVLQHL